MKTPMIKRAGLGVLVCSLFALSGCTLIDRVKDMFTPTTGTSAGASGDGSTVLLHINDKPSLTEAEFDKFLDQVIQSNPYFKQIGKDNLPVQIKRKIFDRVVQQRLIVEKARALKFTDKAEYQKSFNETMKLVENSLLVQLFEKDILDSITVDEAEVTQEFENNKARYVKVAGGSLVEGAKFSTEKEAQAFAAKAKAKMSEFAKLAKEEKGGTYTDFGRVDKEPRPMMGGAVVSAAIRKAVADLKTLPSVTVVKDGDSAWALYVHDKKESVYFEFAEIKQQLEMMVKMNKFKKILEERMEALKNEFTVKTNDGYFQVPEAKLTASNQPKTIRMPIEALEKQIKPIQQAQNDADSSTSA